MKRLGFILIFIMTSGLHITGAAFATDCGLKETKTLYRDTLAKINAKKQAIESVLAGKVVNGFNSSELFGYEQGKDPKQVLIDLKNSHTKNEGISTENLYLYGCLKQFELSDNILSLKEKSKELNSLTIDLLKKNDLLNNSLKANIDSNNALPALISEIGIEQGKTRKTKSEIEKSIAVDTAKIDSTLSSLDKEYIGFSKKLKEIKVVLLERKIEYSESLEKKIKYFESKKPTNLTSFDDVEKVWNEVSAENLNQLVNTDLSFNFPTIPAIPAVFSKLSEEKKEEIELLRISVEVLKDSIIEDLTHKKEKELKLLNDLNVEVNNLRSALFSQKGIGFKLASVFSISGLTKIKDEALLSPYRVVSYLYSKYFRVRESISKGRQGYLNISLTGVKYLFLLLFLFGIQKSIKFIEGYISKKLRAFVIQSKNTNIFKTFYSIWNKIKEQMPEIFWLFVADTLSNLEAFSSIKFLFEIIKIIALARLIKFSVTLFLGHIAMVTTYNFAEFKKKSNLSSDSFKNIYSTYAFAVLFLELAIGKVYIYSVVSWIVIIFSTYKVLKVSADWDFEFKKYLEAKFSGLIVERFQKGLYYIPKTLKPFFLFVALVSLEAFNGVVKLTENFTFSKKISANIFKKQIENIEADDTETVLIPQDYKDRFDFKSLSNEELYVVQDQKLEESIHLEIEEWALGKSEEHSLVIYGDKGIGKTSLIKHIISGVKVENEKLNTIYTKMPAKTLSKLELQQFICSTLGIELDGKNFDFPAIDKKLDEKKVIFVDECQNIFLSHTGGFDAYYYLTELMNMATENIFWFLSFNKSSWIYLNSAFDRTQFFRNVFELKGWTDIKVKELVMRRHDESSYKLSYDLLINATRSQDEIDKYASIESKFFKLLWELSRGNPRTALALWLTALSRKSQTVFNVNVPKELDLADLERAGDDQMFVLAHILKHENLSLNEVISTSNLPRAVVRNSLKMAIEKKYLFRDERSRYMIDITSQHIITKQLKAKNFLYGN